MKITKELVEYVATLSKIKVDDAFKEKMEKELGAVIDYMEILNKVDTDGVEPLSHVFSINNVLRKDEVLPSHNREELIKNAPERGETTFIVPKAVE